MARMLVTGGAGFIGSHLAERLVALGHRVVVLDDLSTGRAEYVPDGAELVEGSLLDEELVGRLTGDAEFVFHEAARVAIRDSVANFRADADVNLTGTLILLDALRGSPVERLVFASSMGVYGADGLGVRETDVAVAPRSPYGIAKLAAESYCLRLAPELGVAAVALRYCNTYGPRQTPTSYVGVATIFCHRLLTGRRPIVFDDGEQVRDYVHVDDVVEANLRAMETEGVGQAYNVGTGEAVTVNRILALVADRLGVDPDPELRPPHPGELRRFTADPTRATEELGFTARWSLEDRIGEVVDYWKDRADRGALPDLLG